MAFKLVVKHQTGAVSETKDSVKFLLHEAMCGTRKARSYRTVHASDLMKPGCEFCPREYALGMKTLKARYDDRIATAEQITFDYGHAVEDIIREKFARMGRAIGDWKCPNCNQLHQFTRRPTKCSECGVKGVLLEYQEVRVQSTVSGVSCGLDLLVDFGLPRLKIIEIKSMDKEEFKKLEAPIAEHRFRTNVYMRCAAESDHPMKDRIDTQNARVLYVTKGGYGYKDPEIRHWKLLDGDFSPFKEFHIHRDDSLTDDLLSRAEMYENWKKTGELPLGICPTSLGPRAKYCRQVEACFDPKNAVYV